jgi:hypothetical protein
MEPGVPPEESVTDAQITSAKLLTDMLRENFGIIEGNCVTHEMVSVNPQKMLIGYHTDFAGRFPFEKVGLPDNYQLELPSVSAWGLTYDEQFVADMGGRVWAGVRRGQEAFRREAQGLQLDVEQYRRHRQGQYRGLLAKLRTVEPKSHAALLKEQ